MGQAYSLKLTDAGLKAIAADRIERIEAPARGPPPKTCGCRRRNGSSRAPGSCFDGVQPFRFSECVSSPVERLSGVAVAVADLFVSPKNWGPDHWAPVMWSAILVSER